MQTYQIYINGIKSGKCDSETPQDAIDCFVATWGNEIGDAKVEARLIDSAETKTCDLCLKSFPTNKIYSCATEDHGITENVCKNCF